MRKRRSDFINRVGEKYITNEGYSIIIIEYFKSKNCTIQFENGYIMYNQEYRNVRTGQIRNPYHTSAYGVGYLGVGKYKSHVKKVPSKTYKKWIGMIERCYSQVYHTRKPTYKDINVYEQWHNFQIFAEWSEENYKPEYMEGWHIDKDILVKGNKHYSPKTCCFVPPEINCMFTKSSNVSELPVGVKKEGKKYTAYLNHKYLGFFNTPEEAFECYKFYKENYIKEVADKWKPFIEERVYLAMYNYKVEITD